MPFADGRRNARPAPREQADPAILATVGEDLFRLLCLQLEHLDDAAGAPPGASECYGIPTELTARSFGVARRACT